MQSTVAALVVPASAAAFGPVAEALNSNKGNERQTLYDSEDLRNDASRAERPRRPRRVLRLVDTDRRPDGATTHFGKGGQTLTSRRGR